MMRMKKRLCCRQVKEGENQLRKQWVFILTYVCAYRVRSNLLQYFLKHKTVNFQMVSSSLCTLCIVISQDCIHRKNMILNTCTTEQNVWNGNLMMIVTPKVTAAVPYTCLA